MKMLECTLQSTPMRHYKGNTSQQCCNKVVVKDLGFASIGDRFGETVGRAAQPSPAECKKSRDNSKLVLRMTLHTLRPPSFQHSFILSYPGIGIASVSLCHGNRSYSPFTLVPSHSSRLTPPGFCFEVRDFGSTGNIIPDLGIGVTLP